jgi:hypothetical protein
MNALLRENGYLAAPGLLDPHVARFIYRTLLVHHWRGEYARDGQVNSAASFRRNAMLDTLLLELRTKMEEISGCTLVPTYCYARLYFQGDVLERHHDREACEISATIHLGRDGGASSISFPPDVEVAMEVGDGAVYRGFDIDHWRAPFTGVVMGQLFAHYVQAGGRFADHAYDRAPHMFPPARTTDAWGTA